MPNMTYAQWQASLAPKVTGTWILHSLFGNSLDFFILLSSVCGIFGSHGQGNYSSAGTFQDAFARYRASLNLPVRTIDLGSVVSEGYTAENKSAADHAHRQGCNDMLLEELFALVNHAITDPIPKDVASSQVLVGTTRLDPTVYTNKDASVQRADPIFSHTWTTNSTHSPLKDGSYKIDLWTTLSTATTRQAAIKAIQIAVVGKLSQLLAMPAEEIRIDQSVSSYGADSLVAIELRNWVSKQLEAQVQNFELMSGQPIHALAKLIGGRSRLVPQTLFTTD
jgi:acyl carrier protein